MKRVVYSVFHAFVFILLFSSFSFAFNDSTNAPKDIVLMIDNSGSMKQGDPSFMTKASLTEFINNLPDDSENLMLAVLIFDNRVRMAIPLTVLSETTKIDILSSLDSIDYNGQLTNIPAGMERAIYELKNKGREDSQKFIIFITDGIVDTGDKQRDIEKTTWLRENLSEDAVKNGIKIFGIAFTDAADFELIQSLAQKTGGEYFRAQIPEEISEVFSTIRQLIMNMQPETVEMEAPSETITSTPAETPPAATMEASPIYVTEAPKPTPPPVAPKKPTMPNMVLPVLIVLAILLIGVLFFLFRYRRKPIGAARLAVGRNDAIDDQIPEAMLRDISGVTDRGFIKIDRTVTKIGRIEGINHIVIDQSTISRQHAVIEYKNFSFWMKDMKSSNGTYVNGNRVADPLQLNHGDTIAFDVYEFEFVMPGMDFDETVVDRTVFRSIDDQKDS